MEHMIALEARGVTLRRGGRLVLDAVDMQARLGEVTALVGPNGAGKSTLLAALCGQLGLDAGQVLWMGGALPASARLAQERAVVEQRFESAFGWSAREVVELGRLPHRRDLALVAQDAECVRRALDAVGLSAYEETPVGRMSGGEQQRVQIARALAQVDSPHGKALLMDEPTASLDWSSAGQIYRLARDAAARGLAVVIVLHDLQAAAQIADHVVMMVRGGVMASGPAAQVLEPALVSRAFGGIRFSGALVPDFLASSGLVEER